MNIKFKSSSAGDIAFRYIKRLEYEQQQKKQLEQPHPSSQVTEYFCCITDLYEKNWVQVLFVYLLEQ